MQHYKYNLVYFEDGCAICPSCWKSPESTEDNLLFFYPPPREYKLMTTYLENYLAPAAHLVAYPCNFLKASGR